MIIEYLYIYYGAVRTEMPQLIGGLKINTPSSRFHDNFRVNINASFSPEIGEKSPARKVLYWLLHNDIHVLRMR